MQGVSRLKPIAGVITVVLGSDEVVCSWTTSLQPLHVQDDAVIASGALIASNGNYDGIVNLTGFPLSEWPQSKPQGRPSSFEKHLAVLLAWGLSANRWNGKYGEADKEIATLFDYSEPKKVRDIRVKNAQKIGLDISKDECSLLNVKDCGDGPEGSVLIKKPTWIEVGSGLEVKGDGYIWLSSYKERVLQGDIHVRLEDPQADYDFRLLSKKGGPVMISFIQPGRVQNAAL